MKHTKQMYAHWKQSFNGKDDFSLFPFDMSSCGYVLIGTQMIDFEVPDDFNPVPIQIDMLEAEKKKAMEEFNLRVARINDQISKLQSLEFSGDVVDAEVPNGQ